MIASGFFVQHVESIWEWVVKGNWCKSILRYVFVYFVNFGAKCFGLAFGGTFTRLEENLKLRTAASYKSEETIAGLGRAK